MLIEFLADPQIARSIRNPFVGTVFPFVAGACTTFAKDVGGGSGTDRQFGYSCGGGDFYFPGAVGIGTAAPAFKLDVASALGNGAQSYIRISDTTADVTGGFYGGANATLIIGAQRAGFSDGAGGILDVTTNHPLFLKTNDQTRMTILGGGNVGIGTSSPAEKLDVIGNIKSDGLNKIIFLRPLGGSNDDQPQIQAAINALQNLSPTGGIIMLTPGPYNIGSQITINKSGVKLRGYGTKVTVLKWTGSGAGTIVKFDGYPYPTNALYDVELADLALDGDSKATIGLHVVEAHKSLFQNLWIDKVNNSAGDAGTGIYFDGGQQTHWSRIEVHHARKTGVYITNAVHSGFYGLNIQEMEGTTGTVGLWLHGTDNDFFYEVLTPANAKVGILLDSGEDRANYFYHIQASGQDYSFKIENADTNLENKNMIFGYDRENAQMEPRVFNSSGVEVDPGLHLMWFDSRGHVHLGKTTEDVTGSDGTLQYVAGSPAKLYFTIGGTRKEIQFV